MSPLFYYKQKKMGIAIYACAAAGSIRPGHIHAMLPLSYHTFRGGSSYLMRKSCVRKNKKTRLSAWREPRVRQTDQ